MERPAQRHTDGEPYRRSEDSNQSEFNFMKRNRTFKLKIKTAFIKLKKKKRTRTLIKSVPV